MGTSSVLLTAYATDERQRGGKHAESRESPMPSHRHGWLRSFRGRPGRPLRRPLRVEPLENRLVPYTWTPFSPSFSQTQALMLLSDGTVMAQLGNDSATTTWDRLTPDAN